MLTVHDGLTRARVGSVVEELAAKGATGVLEMTGEPSGALYLDGGRIAFAAASWVPGLVDRLRGLRTASPRLQELLAGWDCDDAAAAALACQRGYLTEAALHELIRSIAVDAFLVLVLPLPENSSVADIRFTSVRTHVTALFPRLAVDSVGREALGRAERMAAYGLAPTTAVALRDLRRPSAVLTREQWAAASQITENASARELAWRHGTGLAEMTECLGSLARAGLCAPVRAGGARRQLPPAGPSPRLVARGGGGGVSGAGGGHAQAWPPSPASQAGAAAGRHVGHGQGPTTDILRQVLNGLRNLS